MALGDYGLWYKKWLTFGAAAAAAAAAKMSLCAMLAGPKTLTLLLSILKSNFKGRSPSQYMYHTFTMSYKYTVLYLYHNMSYKYTVLYLYYNMYYKYTVLYLYYNKSYKYMTHNYTMISPKNICTIHLLCPTNILCCTYTLICPTNMWLITIL